MYFQDKSRIYGMVQAAGFGWTKQQVRWADVEAVQGSPDWTELDDMVNQAAANNVQLLFSIVTSPSWSRADGAINGPPDDAANFANFLTQMATRYAGQVGAYEVWNEQNLSREWGGAPLSAGDYVELLKVAYAAIKQADPAALVISGALSPTGLNDANVAVDDALYMQQMYGYQGGVISTVCDAVGAHAGGYNNPPDDTPQKKTVRSNNFKGHPSFYFRRIEQLRDAMVLGGDSAKQMWVTEFGWSTSNKVKGYEYGADNTEADQASYLVRAFEIGRQYGWVGGMFVWNLNFQQIVDDRDEKWAFGVVRKDGSPRPSFTALARMPKNP